MKKNIISFIAGVALTALPLYVQSRALAATPDSVGYIGCSMTDGAVKGYRNGGGTTLWGTNNPTYNIAGGVVARWSTVGVGYWTASGNSVGYEGKQDTHGVPEKVWFMACSGKGGQGITYDQAVSAINILKTYTPDAEIYISGQPTYEADHICNVLGNNLTQQQDAFAVVDSVVSQVISDGLALPGPTMPTLLNSQLIDTCHPNTAGQDVLGGVVASFFDSAEEPSLVWVCRDNMTLQINESDVQEGEASYATQDEAANDPNCQMVWVCRDNVVSQVSVAQLSEGETSYATQEEAETACADPDCEEDPPSSEPL